MDLLQQTKDLCRLYNIVPTKTLGQNFLIDENVLSCIIKEAKSVGIKNILEIGGGFGFLTTRLLDISDRVFVVERDEKLFNGLQKIEKVSNNKLKIIYGNALDLFNRDCNIYSRMKSFFNNEEYIVVANIPYNITSILLRKLLSEIEYFPKNLILMVQKEVGDRICGVNNDNSVLSIMVNFYCKTNIVSYVNKKSFFPSPEVDSVVIRLDRTNENIEKINGDDPEYFFKFVNSGFLNRRKMLYHNISSVYRLEKQNVKEIFKKNKLDEKIRAQDLSVNDWISLWYNIKYEK